MENPMKHLVVPHQSSNYSTSSFTHYVSCLFGIKSEWHLSMIVEVETAHDNICRVSYLRKVCMPTGWFLLHRRRLQQELHIMRPCRSVPRRGHHHMSVPVCLVLSPFVVVARPEDSPISLPKQLFPLVDADIST